MTKIWPSIIFVLIFIIIGGCGDDYKTPADIKENVAWLDARSALPVFPFGTNPIYICFYSPNSQPCKIMTERVFDQPEIIKYMNKNFTCISVIPEDIDSVQFLGQVISRKDLLRALKVEGLPSHYFFDKSGKLLGARTGYIKLIEFKQLVKFIGEGYVAKYDFGTFMSMPESEVSLEPGKF